MTDPRVPVAWLHADHRTAYVITDKVKQVWLQVDPKHVEHYTVPLYLDRWDGATLLRAPMALGGAVIPPVIVNKPKGMIERDQVGRGSIATKSACSPSGRIK